MAMPAPEKREVFILRHGATGVPDSNPFLTTTCVILDYSEGKAFRRSSGNVPDADNLLSLLNAKS